MEKIGVAFIPLIFGLALIIRPDIYQTLVKVSNAARGIDTSSKYPLKVVGRIIGFGLIMLGFIVGLINYL